MSQLKLPPYQKSPQRKSYAGFSSSQSRLSSSQASNFSSSFQLLATAPSSSLNNLPGKIMANEKIPDGYVHMDHQVAGHTFQVGTDEIGMLKSIDDGSVLKPGGSPMCAAREIKFYESLLTTTDPNVLPLKEFIAEYRGTQTLSVGTKTIKFIKLRDLTHSMLEPCVIDLKMGTRTWDPMATQEKKLTEDSKYKDCKETVGFCIPGFQTFHISSGVYKKFGKEYGKKLNQNTVTDAFNLFLNADSGLSRQLINSILTQLWAIQKWMQTQKVFQFYSSSILIVYDARKLQQVLNTQKRQSSSLNTLDFNSGNTSPTNGGELSPNGSFKVNNSLGDSEDSLSDLSKTQPKSVYKKIQRSHSSTNNYDKEMRNMKYNYQQMLDNLVGTYDEKMEWVHVKMIDFAHTFTNSELAEGQAPGLDLNYLKGIDNLVRIFENFLKKCET